MAKVKRKSATKVKKKQWFKVVAPDIFKNLDVGEVAAVEANNLVGRNVELNYMLITNSPKDQNKKVTLKINDVKGETAYTVPYKFFVLDNYLQRSTKRYGSRLMRVMNFKTKDNQNVKVKVLSLCKHHIPASLKTKIMNRAEENLSAKLSNSNAQDLFVPGTTEKLAQEVKKDVKTIYPVDRVTIWKMSSVAQ